MKELLMIFVLFAVVYFIIQAAMKYELKRREIKSDKELKDLIENGTIRILTEKDRMQYAISRRTPFSYLTGYEHKKRCISFKSKIEAADHFRRVFK